MGTWHSTFSLNRPTINHHHLMEIIYTFTHLKQEASPPGPVPSSSPVGIHGVKPDAASPYLSGVDNYYLRGGIT